MGIRNIGDLVRTEENSVTFGRHKAVDFPLGSNLHGKSCVRCGRKLDHQIHIKEDEDTNENQS